MSGTTKIKSKIKNGVVEIKALASHPMLSYQEAERAKKKLILLLMLLQKLEIKLFMKHQLLNFIKDHYLKFNFKGAKAGDVLELTWKDLKGNTDVSTATIK